MTLTVPPWAAGEAATLPYPIVFATVSGAHLYGFPSADSDLDLRAAHLLPVAEVVGLHTGPETVQHTGVRAGVGLDVVSHDLRKFAKLLASPNGYVLEQLLSPLVVLTGPLHASLSAARAALDHDVPRLRADLEAARDTSPLPPTATPETVNALHDLVVRARLETAVS